MIQEKINTFLNAPLDSINLGNSNLLKLNDIIKIYWGDEPIGQVLKGKKIFSPKAESLNSEFLDADKKILISKKLQEWLDQKIQEISAASIVAKVVRDKFMVLVDPIFPQFEFSKHKGYGTKFHMDALKTYKATLIHRNSFAPVKKNLPDDEMLKSKAYKYLLGDQKKELEILNKEIKNWFSLKNLIY